MFKRVTYLILKKMESTYPQFCVFEKQLYKFKDIKNVHYILSLICFNNWFFYRFCDQDFELDYNQGWKLYSLFPILVCFWNLEELLDWNQYNLSELKQFAFRLYPFLEECYKADKRSLEVFRSHYYYLSRYWYTGQKKQSFIKRNDWI